MEKRKLRTSIVLKNVLLGLAASAISVFAGISLILRMCSSGVGILFDVMPVIGLLAVILILQSASMIESGLRVTVFIVIDIVVLILHLNFKILSPVISAAIKLFMLASSGTVGGEFGLLGYGIIFVICPIVIISVICISLAITAFRSANGKKDMEYLDETADQ